MNYKDERQKKKNENLACEKCGHNRWKTIEKGKKWQCRKCGFIREGVEK